MYPIFEIQNTNASQFCKSKNIFSTAVRTAELDYSDFKHLCLRIPARVFPTIFVSPTLVRRGGSGTILQNVGGGKIWNTFVQVTAHTNSFKHTTPVWFQRHSSMLTPTMTL